MSFQWIRDQLLEQTLRRLGIACDTETVPVAQIDQEEGLKRQSRLIGKLNDDYVARLGVQMLEPDARFKMFLLQKPARGSKNAKYWQWSGNHRFAAFREAFPDTTSIECYTCNLSDPLMMDVISTATNCIESEIGFSREERVIKARFWIEKHNMSVTDAARIVGLKPEAIYAERQAADTKNALLELGIEVNGMSRQILRKLSVLSRNRNVLRSAARTIHEYGVKGAEATSFITDVARAKTEGQQLSEVDRWAGIFEARKSPRKRNSGRRAAGTIQFQTVIRDRTLRHLTGLEKVLTKVTNLTQLQLTDPADFEVAKKAVKIIVPKLIQVFEVK